MFNSDKTISFHLDVELERRMVVTCFPITPMHAIEGEAIFSGVSCVVPYPNGS